MPVRTVAPPAGADEDIVASVSFHADALGLPRPPVRVMMKGFAAAGSKVGSLLVWYEGPTALDRLLTWLRLAGVNCDHLVALQGRNVLLLDRADMPDAISDAGAGVYVREVSLGPDGEGAMTLEGPRASLQKALANTGGTDHVAAVGARKREPERPRLTGRQAEAVEHAIRAGYYDFPRAAKLRDVAASFGVAASSMARLLRGAEANIMAAWVARGVSRGAEREKDDVIADLQEELQSTAEEFTAQYEAVFEERAVAEEGQRVLRSSNDDLRAAVEATAGAVLACEQDGRVVLCTRSAALLLHLPPQRVVGRVLWDICPPLQDASVRAAVLEAVKEGGPRFALMPDPRGATPLQVQAAPLPSRAGSGKGGFYLRLRRADPAAKAAEEPPPAEHRAPPSRA